MTTLQRKMKILLGSNSPRRKELLQSLGFDFEVVSINCDEVFPENLSVENIDSRSKQKWRRKRKRVPRSVKAYQR